MAHLRARSGWVSRAGETPEEALRELEAVFDMIREEYADEGQKLSDTLRGLRSRR